MQALCAERWRARTGSAMATSRPTRGAILDRRPARGRRDPRLHQRRPVRAGQGGGPRAGRLRLAARGHEARAADGRHRRRADRLARLRRAAGLPLARAPEPGRLLQGVGGGGHQPRDRPRARGGALLLPRGARRAPGLAARGRAEPATVEIGVPGRCSAATTAWRRSPTRPTARSPTSTRPTCSRTCGRPSAAAAQCSTSRASSPRTPAAPSSGSSRRPRPPCAAAPSCWCSRDRTAYEGDRRYLDPHLALAAVDLALREHLRRRTGETNLRRRCGVVLRSAAIRNVHDVVLALGLGADGVCPYAMVEVSLVDDYRTDVGNLARALRKGIEKVISTIGIHEVRGYARLFASIGLKPELATLLRHARLHGLEGRRHGLRRARRRRRRAPARAGRRGRSPSPRRRSASTPRSTRRRSPPPTARRRVRRVLARRCASSSTSSRSRCATSST